MIHHHSHFFANVKCKADVQKKIYDIKAASINLQYLVLNSCLIDFWNEVVYLTSTVVNVSDVNWVEFKVSFFIIFKHDLKLHFKWDIANHIHVNFQKSLQLCFHWSSDIFSFKNCWLNFDMKNTLQSSFHHFVITLLCKTTCFHD